MKILISALLILVIPIASFAGQEEIEKMVNDGLALLKAQKYSQSKHYFEAVCNKDIAEGCFNLGAACMASGDAQGAKGAYEKACRLGKWACAGLAASEYRAGNIAKSTELYEVACKADNFQACTDLAYLKPESERQALYQKGCTGGSMEGCNNLAFIIDKENPTEAFQLYKKACDADYIDACNNLAFIYYKKGNYSQALDMYKYACKKGQTEACGSVPRIEQAMSSNKEDAPALKPGR
jgi:TPR repeat protein